ncbi:hypothetical protein [Mycolicibacterium fortuitum]|uniref:hypothetical protein n=1 Tax=Mycolicibacterium fortuitum TaxID=1766 RepID=UPI0007EB3E4A|nr:hypothetical protein [Mycolicibacterium fortuitum]OBF77079.1 hypothetical protein A5751_23150 [Mycolicibacterium fortuitum]
MTPIWDELVDQHGDPLDSLPWLLADAAVLCAKWLASGPSVVRPPARGYTIAEVDSMRWAGQASWRDRWGRRGRLASVADAVAPVLKDANLRVTIGSAV